MGGVPFNRHPPQTDRRSRDGQTTLTHALLYTMGPSAEPFGGSEHVGKHYWIPKKTQTALTERYTITACAKSVGLYINKDGVDILI